MDYKSNFHEEIMPSPDELRFWDIDLIDIALPVPENEVREGSGFDLEERTARFGEEIIRFLKTVKQSSLTNRLIDQLVGAWTSVGANYCEANDYVSAKDFRYRISICRKESKECRFFLRMIVAADETKKAAARLLWKEATELNLIFGAIWRKA